jgi:hypothetical protein
MKRVAMAEGNLCMTAAQDRDLKQRMGDIVTLVILV